MKKLLICVFTLASVQMWAQPDDIVYYEDSDVRNSRFSINLVANPSYTDRRLINDEVPAGAGLDLVDDRAAGGFAFNYNLDLFYSIGSSFDIGVGLGRAEAFYSVERAQLYNTEAFDMGVEDTVLVDAETEVNMWTVPIKISFNTSVTDIFDLEVIPTVSLIFIDKYETRFRPLSGTEFTKDFTEQTQDMNYTVGISLGGTWYVTDNLGFFFRANANYMLNSMIEVDSYPRETLYSVGSNLGLKIRF